jgi:hypothetical protein
MCKKIGIAAVAVLAGLLVLNNTRLGSWVGFAWKKAKDGICSKVPLEVKIEHLKYELAQLEPEIRKAENALARDIVAMQDLQKEVDNGQKNLTDRYAAIMKAKKEVDAGTKQIAFGGHTLTPDKAKAAITREWESYLRAEKTLKSKEKLLEAKVKHVAESKQALENWGATRDQLLADINEIDDEIRAVRLAESESHFQIDNERVARFQKDLEDLKKEVRVKQEEQKLHGTFRSSPEGRPVVKNEAADRAWQEMEEREQKGEVVEK